MWPTGGFPARGLRGYAAAMKRPRHTAFWSATAIFAGALALRAAYLVQIRDLGFFTRPLSDGYVYDQRARGIAAGDWLGPPDFVHAPLYAYALGVVRVLGGDSVWSPRVWQAIAGALGCVLVLCAARQLFNLRVGVLAAVLLALYPPAIFFDGLLQKTSLTLLLSVLTLYLALRAGDRATVLTALATGLVLGLLVLNRQNSLVLAPLIGVWLWLARPASRRHRAGLIVAATLGLAVTLLPWAARNRVVLGEWVLTTPNLGQNFAMGNHPRATGTYLPPRRGYSSGEREQREWVRAAQKAVGRRLSAQEVSDYYLYAAVNWIRAHPGDWLHLTVRKLALVWNAYELPDTEDYYLYCERSSLLRSLDRVWHFGILTPLAAVGIIMTRADWRRLWFLYVWLLLTTLSVAAFVVFARYRLPLVPVLLILAAAGIDAAVRRLRTRQVRPLVVPLIALLLVAVGTNCPVQGPRNPRAFSYVNHAVALADLGRYEEALKELDRALQLAPADVDALLIRGSVWLEQGRYAEALAAYEDARRGDPSYAGCWRGVGDALVGLGRVDEALEAYQHAATLDPDDPAALNCVGMALARLGRLSEALATFQRVTTTAPDYPEAWLNLGNTYLTAGRLDEAADAYGHALRLRPDYADALHNLGVVEARRGRLPRAVELFEHAFRLVPHRRDFQHSFLRALVAAGQTGRAADLIDELLRADPQRADLQELRAALPPRRTPP